MARRRLFPESGSEAIRVASADVVFDGRDSPITQTFGLGLFQPPTPEDLEGIEQFFRSRGAATQHEVSPFAGAATLQLLCARAYRPIEISQVMNRPIEVAFDSESGVDASSNIGIRVIDHDDAALWSDISARGWSHEHPDFEPFVREMGTVLVNRENSPCFLAEIDGHPGAAAALVIHEGVALLAGASTVPEFRRRGLQTALLAARIRFAREQGCDQAMLVAEPGSNSQRNAQRQGFLIAYTRLKWQKRAEPAD